MKTMTKLTDAQMRVKIAKDVLKQLKANKLVASERVYVQFPESITRCSVNTELQEYLEGIDEKEVCKVCALGSLMLSNVRFNDKLTVQDIRFGESKQGCPSSGPVKANLETYFNPVQMGLIESAFQKDSWFAEFSTSQNLKSKAVSFGFKYLEASERMVAIMRNIIKNNGKFKP